MTYPIDFQNDVIAILCRGPMSGRELRQELWKRGNKKSGTRFYQLMSRLEDGGLVKGELRTKKVEGHPITERIYSEA